MALIGGFLNISQQVTGREVLTVGSVSATSAGSTDSPIFKISNPDSEDTDGGRAGRIVFQGFQSGGESSTLAEIVAQHSGSSDDEMGEIVFKLNDGDDSASPSKQATLSPTGSSGAPILTLESYWSGYYIYGTAMALRRNALDLNYESALVRNTDNNALMGMMAQKGGSSNGVLYASYLGYFYFSTTDTVTGYERVGIGTGANVDTMLHIQGPVPYITLQNDTSEDSEGGRESKITFEGSTVAGGATFDAVQHELGEIVVSHHGTANDKKGKFELFLNDGDDSDGSLTQALYLDTLTTGNVAIGSGALGELTTGEYNVAIGKDAGAQIQESSRNFFIGSEAGSRLRGSGGTSIATQNVAIGQKAMGEGSTTYADNTAYANVALGYMSLGGDIAGSNLTAYQNVCIGNNTAKEGTSMERNVFIGSFAGESCTTGSSNIGIGYYSLGQTSLAGATFNVGVGRLALYGITSADYNIAMGGYAGDALTTGGENIVIGHQALTTEDTGAKNTAIGYQALYTQNYDGNGHNIAIGYQAMYTNDDGVQNVAIGTSALYTANSDNSNVAIGYEAGYYCSNERNTFVGYRAGKNSTSGLSNVAIGAYSWHNPGITGDSNGNYNNLIGDYTCNSMNSSANGNNIMGYQGGGNLSTGDYNTILGHINEPPSSSAVYSTGVGAYVKPNNDYDIRLGMNGGVSYISRRLTLTTSYTTPASGDAAHANALFKIPPFSYIERVHVTVITLSAGTADFNIQYSTTLNTASGTGLTAGTEILGAGVDTSHWTVRSQATNNAASDINASSDDTAKMTWVSINKDADASEGWVGSGEIGIYITHAGSNSSSDPGADAVLQVTVYYTGAND